MHVPNFFLLTPLFSPRVAIDVYSAALDFYCTHIASIDRYEGSKI